MVTVEACNTAYYSRIFYSNQNYIPFGHVSILILSAYSFRFLMSIIDQ